MHLIDLAIIVVPAHFRGEWLTVTILVGARVRCAAGVIVNRFAGEEPVANP